MIPHIIHFTVPKVIRPEQQEAINLAREKHPGWEIKVWQDPVDPSSHRLGKYWPYVNSGAQLADLIRLDVIFEHGGVYLDSDFHMCKPLADIADNCDFFIGSEDGQFLTNAVFGATAGHPALGALIEDLLRTAPDWTLAPWMTTGPQFFARVLKWRKDINAMPRAAFYPYNWNEPVQPPHPATYGTHHWAASWKTATTGFNPRRLLSRGVSRLRTATTGFNPRRLLSRSVSRLRDRMRRSERILQYLSSKIDGYSCSEVLVRRTAHGQSILLSGRDLSVTPEIYMNGYYELREEMFLKRILKGGDYFVDVGANVGILALTAAARVGSFGRVFCYEPNPSVADLLQKSSLMNWMHERVIVRLAAVGSKRSTAKLMVAPSRLGDAALEAKQGHGGAYNRTRELIADAELVDVEVVTLDQEFPFNIPIRAVKIDAEGFEAEVLKGADRLFRSHCIDFVIIEAVEEVAGQTWPSLLEAIAKLEEYGYEPYIFVRDGAIRRTNLQSVGRTGGQASRNIVLRRHGAQY